MAQVSSDSDEKPKEKVRKKEGKKDPTREMERGLYCFRMLISFDIHKIYCWISSQRCHSGSKFTKSMLKLCQEESEFSFSDEDKEEDDKHMHWMVGAM